MQMEIRAAAIRGIDRLADNLGGDGAALLAEFGVSPGDLDSDHGLLSTVTAGRILRRATKTPDCPDLGLRLAAYQDMSMLGPLALTVGNCDSIGEGLACASRFLFVHNQGIRLSRADDPERYYAGSGPSSTGRCQKIVKHAAPQHLGCFQRISRRRRTLRGRY
ncbi:AraC family transcriptional regulator ligand-binding domain-containing protein [Kitasatospora sp. NPDC088346]|uniref:AraC family transcriptional regulator ligand-binding domain-containing protein n=1 Tax=Kitasatospora sp. NPDC088346 TaxID=3364073 RepID=UPI0038199B8E